jgi:hypothetical protein
MYDKYIGPQARDIEQKRHAQATEQQGRQQLDLQRHAQMLQDRREGDQTSLLQKRLEVEEAQYDAQKAHWQTVGEAQKAKSAADAQAAQDALSMMQWFYGGGMSQSAWEPTPVVGSAARDEVPTGGIALGPEEDEPGVEATAPPMATTINAFTDYIAEGEKLGGLAGRAAMNPITRAAFSQIAQAHAMKGVALRALARDQANAVKERNRLAEQAAISNQVDTAVSTIIGTGRTPVVSPTRRSVAALPPLVKPRQTWPEFAADHAPQAQRIAEKRADDVLRQTGRRPEDAHIKNLTESILYFWYSGEDTANPPPRQGGAATNAPAEVGVLRWTGEAWETK